MSDYLACKEIPQIAYLQIKGGEAHRCYYKYGPDGLRLRKSSWLDIRDKVAILLQTRVDRLQRQACSACGHSDPLTEEKLLSKLYTFDKLHWYLE